MTLRSWMRQLQLHWRRLRTPQDDSAWKPTGIRQIYPGVDREKLEAAGQRNGARFSTAEARRVAREVDHHKA